jgi:lipooligosaccharide transport system ATP-binding protein
VSDGTRDSESGRPAARLGAPIVLVCRDREAATELVGAIRWPGRAVAVPRSSSLLDDVSDVTLVVLDRAPEPDAVQFVERMRGSKGGDTLLLLAIVPADAAPDRTRLLTAGADDAISAPVDPAELAARVAALWRRRDLRPEPAISEAVPPAPEAVVSARGLTKRFGALTAVDAIDLEVRRGESVGVLGPNGAGKTSTMRMISCVSPRTDGDLRVLGLDPASDGPRVRARLGVVPQQDSLDVELSVEENLIIFGRYFGLSFTEARTRAARLLEFMQLADRAKDEVEPLSGGMKRRLAIARGLVNDPDILLLDEPTTGLDPQVRHLVWERLYDLRSKGVTLLLTTHYMDEAEQLCDRILVMDGGRIVAEGSPKALIAQHVTREVVEVRFTPADRASLNGHLNGLADRMEQLPDRILMYTSDGEAAARALHDRGLRPESLLIRRGSLEDVFLTVTGRTLVD